MTTAPHREIRRPAINSAAWLALLTVVAFVFAAPTVLIVPNAHDSCIFMWMGQRLWAGDLPYRDLWDNKLPVLYWLNATAAATGRPTLAIYVLTSLAIAAGGGMVYDLARRMLARWPARLAGLAYVTLAAHPTLLMTGNLTENWAAPAAILAVWAMVRYATTPRPQTSWAILSGLGLGVATSFRQPAGLIGLVLLASLPLLWRRRRIRPAAIVGWLAGFVLLPLAMLIWAAAAGVLEPMVQQCFLFNLRYGTTGSRPDWSTWSEVGRRFAAIVKSTWPWHLAAGAGLIALAWPRPFSRPDKVDLAPNAGAADGPVLDDPPDHDPADRTADRPIGSTSVRLIVLVWLIAAALSALPSLRFYNHHYYLAIAPLALLAGGLFDRLLAAGRRSWRLVGVAAAVALAAAVAVDFDGQLVQANYERQARQYSLEAADYLARHSRPDESLFVFCWGPEDNILVRAPRPCPTRHVMVIFYPELPGAPDMLAQWRDQMIADPPDWLVCRDAQDIVTGRFQDGYGWNRPEVRAVGQQVHDAIGHAYSPVARFQDGQLIVYRRVAM